MPLRPELLRIVDALLASSEDSRTVSLDALGEAIGARAVTQDEIDGVIAALESAGRKVGDEAGPQGESRLRLVLETARALKAELGRAPTAPEIAARAGLSEDAVRHALALVRVMQR
jgi:hypothetical protein